jgi:Fe-S-cluster containining protein
VKDAIRLNVLDSRIDKRVAAIRAERPDWPCAKGCDHCCRSLPHLPTITKAEWDRLALNEEQRTRVLAASTAAPVTCPLLGPDGACTVYDRRPIACRTYGYYVERDAGLHCGQIDPDWPVTWGNGEAINADLRALGEARSLAEWARYFGGRR